MFRCCLRRFRVTTTTVISRCEICYYVTLGRFGMRPDLLNNTIRNSRLSFPPLLYHNAIRRILTQPLILPAQRRTLSNTFQSYNPNTTLFSLVNLTPLLLVKSCVSNLPINTARMFIDIVPQKDMLPDFTPSNVFQVAFTWSSWMTSERSISTSTALLRTIQKFGLVLNIPISRKKFDDFWKRCTELGGYTEIFA